MFDKKQFAINQGHQAQRLLDDEVLQSAFVTLREGAITDLILAPASDLMERRADVNAINKLESKLRNYIINGKIAQDSLGQN